MLKKCCVENPQQQNSKFSIFATSKSKIGFSTSKVLDQRIIEWESVSWQVFFLLEIGKIHRRTLEPSLCAYLLYIGNGRYNTLAGLWISKV